MGKTPLQAIPALYQLSFARIKGGHNPEFRKLVRTWAKAHTDVHVSQARIRRGVFHSRRQVSGSGSGENRGPGGAAFGKQSDPRLQFAGTGLVVKPGIWAEINRWKAVCLPRAIESRGYFFAKLLGRVGR